MLFQAFVILAAFEFAPTVSAWLPGLTLANGVLTYLVLTAGAAMVGLVALHGGELLGRTLLRLAPFERFARGTIGGSRMTTAICILIYIIGWGAMTGYAAHVFGCDPYWGIPLITVAWLLSHCSVLLVTLPFWLALGMALGELKDA